MIDSWLAARSRAEPILVVAATTEAASEGLRRELQDGLPGATFGRHRTTLPRLAAELAEERLAAEGRVPAGRLAAEAVAARAVAHLLPGGLGRLAAVAETPGFVGAISATLEELRLARLAPPEFLLPLATAYEEELTRAGLADVAAVFEVATEAIADSAHPLVGLATFLLDVPIHSVVARQFVAALAARAPELRASVAAGDEETMRQLRAAGVGYELRAGCAESADCSLGRLQQHLFADKVPRSAPLDDTVHVLSAPGESRECVEVARRLLREAARGVSFDRMAILLRSPDEYRPHLEEALGRAGIPAWFAQGAVQPDPSGRAFLALLTCAAEGLSARAFGEYVSLGQVPRGFVPDRARESAWVPPDADMVAELVADSLADAEEPVEEEEDEEFAAVPRRWEQLLVDAAVIGGQDRWERRLAGLAQQLRVALAEQEREEPEGAAAERTRRTAEELAALRSFALPLLAALAQLPSGPGASWATWLEQLRDLAIRSLRRPARVLATLAELEPMADAGPVGLREVRLVLAGRLQELRLPVVRGRKGRVCVAPIDAARGLEFDVVCVPGLAERLFPRKISEDPILLDDARVALGEALVTNEVRLERERLQLRLAVGSARKRLLLSYPRLDLDQSRPRVPSFYALEALRAATGTLPDFRELARRAEEVTETRVGWPAPRDPRHAIDAAEHDLALLERLLDLDETRAQGTAAYLLKVNPHLARALRFRARRWFEGWTVADGFVAQSGVESATAGVEALRAHQLSRRSFSATALQNFAACPYRFFLHTIHRLAPRELPEAIDELDPLNRGSLVHDVQFELFTRLTAEDGPRGAIDLEAARRRLDDVLDDVAARYREELAPAIDRVWDDGIAAIRADLREWLRRAIEEWHESGYAPSRFELAFGLPLSPGASAHERDRDSVEEPVLLASGIQLRGSIDLVERRAEGDSVAIRVTDQKTGRDRVPKGALVAGGESLQPVLYALAAEQLFPEAQVTEGRLSYCTAAGGFSVRSVPLSRDARRASEVLARTLERALDPEQAFLAALPKERGCAWCDFRVVCGPYEEVRTRRKWSGHEGVTALAALRALP